MPPVFRTSPVRVRVPATSANLGPGFDSLGLALDLHDDVVMSVRAAGLVVDVTGEGAASVPRDGSHLVVRAAHAAFDRLGGRPAGLELHCANRIPHGRGLGSSAAAIVAGIIGARALVVDGEARLDDAAVLRLAAELEGHGDNVAACLHGGLTIAWTEDAGVRAVSLRPDAGVVAVVLVPGTELATATARGLLPAEVPFADAAANVGRSALLVEALTRRPDLLHPATEDRLHQGYRAPAMEPSAALVRHLRTRGVAAVISGAGPTVLALVPADAAPGTGEPPPAGFARHVLAIDPEGVVLMHLA